MANNNVPRKALLPPYMGHAAWQDMADAIDEVFGPAVDNMVDALRYLRRVDIYDEREGTLPGSTPHPVVAKIQSRDLIEASLFDHVDPVTDRLRLNHLGLRVFDPTILDADSVSRLVGQVGSFWYLKGLGTFLDFIAFTLNIEITYSTLWTQDYVVFRPEGHASIGTPVWQGGAWYPTTHVRLDIPSGVSLTQLLNFKRLFYDIANYNLILESLSVSEWYYMLPASVALTTPVASNVAQASGAPAHITAVASFTERIEYIESV